MPYTFEDFYRDLIDEHKEELLKRITLDDLVKSLAPEEILKRLSPEDIEAYLQKLRVQQSDN